MSLIRIDHHPSRRQLLVFKVLWLLVLGGLGLARLRDANGSLVAAVMLALAVLVPALGTLEPRFIRLVYVGLAYLTFPIGFVLSHVLMAVIYFLVLTPTGLLMRLCGHDPMNRRFDPGATTYWLPRPPESSSNDRYFRQF